METPFYCTVCKCYFARNYFLTQHYKTKKHIYRSTENSVVFECNCGKTFLYKKCLVLHKKKCTALPSQTETSNETVDVNTTDDTSEVNLLRIQNEELKKSKEESDKRIEELRAQISAMLDKNAGPLPTINNHNHNNTIDTVNNNITININTFGNENLDYISDKEVMKCIERVFCSVPALLEKIHFDPNHPENHNIKITNRKLPLASVMGPNNQWKLMNRKDAIEKMVNKGYYILDDKYAEKRDQLSERQQDAYDRFQQSFESDDKNTLKNLKKEVELMVLNGVT